MEFVMPQYGVMPADTTMSSIRAAWRRAVS
jgi:hypothetical protein